MAIVRRSSTLPIPADLAFELAQKIDPKDPDVVMLDADLAALSGDVERALELWLPRLATIDGLIDEATTPELVRIELVAARQALIDVGVAGGS